MEIKFVNNGAGAAIVEYLDSIKRRKVSDYMMVSIIVSLINCEKFEKGRPEKGLFPQFLEDKINRMYLFGLNREEPFWFQHPDYGYLLTAQMRDRLHPGMGDEPAQPADRREMRVRDAQFDSSYRPKSASMETNLWEGVRTQF